MNVHRTMAGILLMPLMAWPAHAQGGDPFTKQTYNDCDVSVAPGPRISIFVAE